MPVKLYHYGEKREVWMLTEEEFQLLPPQASIIDSIKGYRKEHNVSLQEAADSVDPHGVNEIYCRITGERAEKPLLIYGRRRSLFGKICSDFGKPFRTPKASGCVEKGCPS